MSTVEISEVVAGYRGGRVLHGIDLVVPSGTLAAVLGPSGCGKTTLLRVLAGFHPVAQGRVSVDGRVLSAPGTQVPPERRRVGIVPQEGALFPHLTVARNVGFGLTNANRHRVEELLELVGLSGLGKRMPSELSGGQQQRVAVARALAPEPAVVLLDEPFSALDAGLRAEVRADVRAALRASGATAVLVTHDQEEALGTADLVAVLRDGRIAQAGTPQQVYTEPADLGVARFVGETVLLDGVADGARVPTALGTLPIAGDALGVGVAVLRPEQLLLGTEGVAARVVDVVFHGHDATVLLTAHGLAEPVRARVQGPLPHRPGDDVRITVSGRARFFPAA